MFLPIAGRLGLCGPEKGGEGARCEQGCQCLVLQWLPGQ